ncbi:hypothetical protein [Kutzneria sp. NPDC051319]|uniref:hypothetical protein n=1 Tax=Kutzneria sp. NPDC051319 TaxID=3155047 RepID=UPI00344A21BD
MTEAGGAQVRVELTLVPSTVPIQGWARDAGGIAHAFTGWLELLEFLDQARISGPARASAHQTAVEGEAP